MSQKMLRSGLELAQKMLRDVSETSQKAQKWLRKCSENSQRRLSIHNRTVVQRFEKQQESDATFEDVCMTTIPGVDDPRMLTT